MANEMKKFNPGSVDLLKENIDKLKELFPQVVSDGEIDFEMLKSILDKNLTDSKEKYQFTWNGKSRTIKLAQTPSNATLLPSSKDGKNWNTTENLYIEGDNLEVLKLLQKTYFNKIKMIYIDPPYNTGKNIIYKNDFKLGIKAYKDFLKDNYTSSMFLNSKNDGRFHTTWLNIMYPLVLLSKNLLTDDGFIFIAIDENELINLTKICDEIYGENNRIGIITILHNPEGRQNSKYFTSTNEFMIVYTKSNLSELNKVHLQENKKESLDIRQTYNNKDEIGYFKEESFIRLAGGFASSREAKPNGWFPIYVSKDLRTISVNTFNDSIEVYPVTLSGNERTWKLIKESTIEKIDKGELYAKKINGNIQIFEKYRITKGSPITTNWINNKYNAKTYGTDLLSKIGLEKFFDFPKSKELLLDIVKTSTNENSIILDFFSGSATTAHAVMQLNAEDGGNRKFIMVQLPEKTNDDSEAYKAGYKNICEIGKERIRRAGELVKKDLIEKNAKLDKDQEKVDPNKLDIGFKVFKLEESNFKEWDSSKEPTIEQLELFADPIKEGKSEEDVLYEVLLKYGVFDQEVKKIKINNKDIYSISENYLIVMLSNKITPEDVEEVKKLKPKIVIFRDSGFNGDDTIKINAFYTLTKSGVEEVKSV
jgi:adenine-specific DNA-methyltransferase